MKTYSQRKEEARNQAITMQSNLGESISYGELYLIEKTYTKLAKRFGLVNEFRENGII